MKICKKCGTEFDGNFCPECGQKWADGNVCPRCGNKLTDGVKFCSECGCRIAESVEDSESDTVETGKEKSYDGTAVVALIFGILRYVPMALVMLFVVLLPLLYIAPIAEANEMLGAESINVYSLDEDFFGVSVAFLVFMCLSVLLVAVIAYFNLSKDRRQKYITVFGKVRASVGVIVSLSAVILTYLPCIIISAVAMGQAATLNEQLGGGIADVVSAGAAPKAVLSLAVIFTVFTVGAAVARILIGKADPDLYPEVEKEEEVEVTPCRRPLLYFAYLNTKLRYAVNTFFVCTLISAIVLTGYLLGGTTLSPHWIIVVCASVTAVAVILSMVVGFPTWSPEAFLKVVQKKSWNMETKLGIKKIIFVIVPLLIIVIMLITDSIMTTLAYERSYIMAAVYIAVSIAVYVAAKITIAVQSGRISECLYGCAGPLPNSKLRVEYDEKRELELYEKYKIAKKHGAVIDGEVTKKKMLIRRLILAAACFAFVTVSVISSVFAPMLIDKFSASYVSSCIIQGRYDYFNYEFLFGEPNEVENDRRILIYYDDEVADLKKQLEKAESQSDMSKVQALNHKLSQLEFNSLIVYTKVKDEGEFKIVLNTKTTVGKTSSQKKTVKSVKLFNAKYIVGHGYTSDSFYAEIFYTDGSYKYELVPTSEFSDIDFNKRGSQTVKWSDEWGNYSATVKST